jgi:hypothetical protein
MPLGTTARAARNRQVHGDDAGTVEAVELHLRADKNLKPDDAETLVQLVKTAYDLMSQPSDLVAYRRDHYGDKWRIERTAASTRKRLGLDQLQVLAPNLLVDELNARVFHLSDLISDDGIALRQARKIGFDGASSFHPDTGRPVIVLNCGRPVRRRMATLMEELAHLLLDHTPSRIGLDPKLGVVRRSFNRSGERGLRPGSRSASAEGTDPERRQGRGTHGWPDRRRAQLQRAIGHLPHPPHDALEPVFAVRPSRIVIGIPVCRRMLPARQSAEFLVSAARARPPGSSVPLNRTAHTLAPFAWKLVSPPVRRARALWTEAVA